MIRVIQFEQAYYWLCPNCESDNWLKPVLTTLTEVEARAMATVVGAADWKDCLVVEQDPESVQCTFCKSDFAVGCEAV